MSGFEGRDRLPLERARYFAGIPGRTRHVLDNGDGTYSVMSHILCDYCDYCKQGGDGPFVARPDPYEVQREPA